jgi:hypothetical protein
MTCVAGRLTCVQWMLGFNLALTLAVLFRVFTACGR